ncbi:MAG TPA: hypothetical protein VGE38_06975 [Nocardioides sp.]|uniref:hypothetical protein n=1 Tax=Nocardioides sp. TaxID=35761 RepID=UPI002ED79AEB
MIVIDTYTESRLDAAISRGFDPHDPDMHTEGPPLDDVWQGYVDAAAADAKARRADVAAQAQLEVAS